MTYARNSDNKYGFISLILRDLHLLFKQWMLPEKKSGFCSQHDKRFMQLKQRDILGCVVNRFVLYYANVKKRISGKWRMHTNDMIYRMNLGLKSNFCYRGARELGAATLATTGNLSMRYFGFYERGHLGVICHRVTEIGKILTGVFAVGVTKVFGRNYCRN